jgi:hypothetical protein
MTRGKTPKRKRILTIAAPARERRMVAAQTAKPVFERLDAGEVGIVRAGDSSGLPPFEFARCVTMPSDLYDRLKSASRRRHTTPNRLAIALLEKELGGA